MRAHGRAGVVSGRGSRDTGYQRVALRVRELILAGDFAPGERVTEEAVAALLDVSRTPVRQALRLLEQESLLASEPRRGFRVRAFTREEIFDAIDARGLLEGWACRQLIERGRGPKTLPILEECLRAEESIIGRGAIRAEDTSEWREINGRFHDAIVAGSGNLAVAKLLAANDRVPLAPARAIVFNTTLPDLGEAQLRRAHEDHERIVETIAQQEAARAEHLMREHARMSRENKARAMADARLARQLRALPGWELVITSPAPPAGPR
jgi:GntR family transcriptional regulator of vanillate catabolism